MGLTVIQKDSKLCLSEHMEDYPDGIIIVLDKPYKWTSADAVRKVKFALQKHFHNHKLKVGHAGTLDPLATGILLICVGKATKLAESLQSERKEYIAKIVLGATTPSFDREHPIDKNFPYKHITLDKIKEAVAGMIGEQDQVPPSFSAKFVDGVRAYDIARGGDDIVLKPSRITVYSAEVLDARGLDGANYSVPENLPEISLKISCSKGTYIRSIARDLGVSLGSGGFLSGLTRTASGGYILDNAISVEQFEQIAGINRDKLQI